MFSCSHSEVDVNLFLSEQLVFRCAKSDMELNFEIRIISTGFKILTAHLLILYYYNKIYAKVIGASTNAALE